MASTSALCLLAALVAAASAAYNSTEMAEVYINLGAGKDPTNVNCAEYAALFSAKGVLHQPGVPDVTGKADLVKACEADHAEIDPLVAYQTLNIPVNSWNMEKRTAVRWTINGVRTSDHSAVSAPAISVFFQNKTGGIDDAWSFYDSRAAAGVSAPSAAYNASAIVQKYIRLGGSATLLPPTNCITWAGLYTPDGASNEPGIPPTSGTADLKALCTRRSSAWKVLTPAVELELPVLTWDMHGRVAFHWTLTGVGADGNKAIAPAITVLFLDTDGKIINSWDWWNTDLLPKPTL